MPLPIAGAAIWAGATMVGRALIGWIVKNAPSFIGNILAALGLYLFVARPLGDTAMNYIISKFSGAPGTVLETLYYLNMDDYVQMVVSAYGVRAAGKVALRKKAA